MAAGVSKRLWDIDDIVAVIEDWEARQEIRPFSGQSSRCFLFRITAIRCNKASFFIASPKIIS
jgi:hypothetical protein